MLRTQKPERDPFIVCVLLRELQNMSFVRAFLSALVIATRKDVAYGLVIIWALLGIAVNQSAHQSVVTTTEISAVVIVIALALSILISRLKR